MAASVQSPFLSFPVVMYLHLLAPCEPWVLNADLEETLLWTLLNSGVALIGYWLAAAVIDNPRVGRLRLQLLGFGAVCVLFYISAAVYPSLTTKKGLPTFQFIYFFSSFWGQFGPNCTTFLLAGESPYVRLTDCGNCCHGCTYILVQCKNMLHVLSTVCTVPAELLDVAAVACT